MGNLIKTKYFTKKNILKKSSSMLKQVKKVVNLKNLEYSFKKSAMLVLDMQKFFLSKESHAYIPSAEAIIPIINELITIYYEKNLPVIFTKHINTKENAGKMERWWRKLIKKENPLSKIVQNFYLSKGIVINKAQYDAFYNTELDKILNKNNVEQLIITGVMTHLCCETTARSAFIRGYDVFFLIDGTATYNEYFHIATILNLAHGFASLVLSKWIKGKLDENL